MLPREARTRWLDGNPCRAPCWEGVTPGVTRANDAMASWATNTLMTDVRLFPSDIIPGWGSVVWNWAGGPQGGAAAFDNSTPSQIISEISVSYPWTYDLDEIITAYGEPTHVVAVASCNPHQPGSGSAYNVRIYFLRQGFVVYESGPFTSDSGDHDLGSGMSRQSITFFKPVKDLGELQLYGTDASPTLAVPWQDSHTLRTYIHDETDGRCFSPTPTPR
jgi:hypothetical protein